MKTRYTVSQACGLYRRIGDFHRTIELAAVALRQFRIAQGDGRAGVVLAFEPKTCQFRNLTDAERTEAVASLRLLGDPVGT